MKDMWGVRGWTRHSLILVMAGVMYIGIGVAFFYAPPQAKLDPSLKIALRWMTLYQWGWVYIGFGITAAISSLWPMGVEKWGYSVLTFISSAWAAFYLLAVILVGAPPIVLISSLLWALLAFLWWAVSGLISPEAVRGSVQDALKRD